MKVVIAGSRYLEADEWIAAALGLALAWVVWLGLFAVWAIWNSVIAERPWPPGALR